MEQPIDENCCVCLEPNKKLTPCNRNLCKKCYSKMHGRKCPICRTNIYKQYKRIKKTCENSESILQSPQ